MSQSFRPPIQWTPICSAYIISRRRGENHGKSLVQPPSVRGRAEREKVIKEVLELIACNPMTQSARRFSREDLHERD